MEFGEDETVAVLPGMTDTGSVYGGVSCNIIKTMVGTNGVTERFLSEKLRVDKETMHEIVRRMIDEDVLMVMNCRKDGVLFLTDRPGWIGRLNRSRENR